MSSSMSRESFTEKKTYKNSVRLTLLCGFFNPTIEFFIEPQSRESNTEQKLVKTQCNSYYAVFFL